MIYRIDGKYYIKIGEHFREIELVFENGDVDTRVVGTFLENVPGLQIEEINFMEQKENLIKEHNSKKENKENKEKSFKRDLFDK